MNDKYKIKISLKRLEEMPSELRLSDKALEIARNAKPRDYNLRSYKWKKSLEKSFGPR